MDALHHVSEELAVYLRRHPQDAERLAEISRRLTHAPDGLYDRSCMEGHVTSSGLLLSPDMRRALLVDHVALGRLLQPGGHYDAVETLADEAIREAVEKTGARGVRVVDPKNGPLEGLSGKSCGVAVSERTC